MKNLILFSYHLQFNKNRAKTLVASLWGGDLGGCHSVNCHFDVHDPLKQVEAPKVAREVQHALHVPAQGFLLTSCSDAGCSIVIYFLIISRVYLPKTYFTTLAFALFSFTKSRSM